MSRKRLGSKEPYARIYASVSQHPRHGSAPLEALGLWTVALSYCAANMTDGKVPCGWLDRYGKRPVKLAIECGLIVRVAGEYHVHDYLDHNRSRDEVEQIRQRERDKKKPRGNPKGKRSGDSPGEHPGEESGDSSRDAVIQSSTTPHSPPGGNSVDFEEWLLHHEQTTGHTAPRTGTKARAAIVEAFGARQAEGYPLADLKLATVGAHEDEYRRTNGYDTAESVLRPTKVAALIARGRLRGGGGPRRTDVAGALDRAYGRTAG